MNIAVIGTGRVGAGLAGAWTAAGHRIVLGARDPDGADARELAGRLGARLATPAGAAAEAEIVVLAVPADALPDLVPTLGLEGKVTVDCTNPVNPRGPSPLPEPGPDGSAAALIARLAPGALVVKGLNTLGSALLARAGTAPGAVTFMAGDAPRAKEVLASLGADLGFAETVDVGGLDAAPLVEAIAATWITLAYRQGRGPDFSFAITTPRL
jgi:8-hydroxy-5-deazaflavin:NADPH oxidoreductase